MDVLVQHLVSMVLGSGFHPQQLLAEVRSTWAFSELRDSQWQWALDFVCHGGSSLSAYPDYQRVERQPDGTYKVASERLARRHRMSIGTIVSDASLQLKYWSKGGGARRWAASKRRSLPVCALATPWCSPGECWNWCAWKT